jgi:DNA polymerase III epsilon subunit-like protein
MPRYLIFDTETSGLPDFKLPADAEGQPRLCAITMILTDEDLAAEVVHSMLIQPNGWEISPEITAINGLTTERCAAEGVPITDALTLYTDAIKDGRIVVAYNAQFDCKIMRGELRRLDLPDLFAETQNVCAMRSSKSLNIEKAGAKKGGFPKLSDTYRHFFKKELDGAHTSLADAMACLEVFRELVKVGADLPPEVHLAKAKPDVAADASKKENI